MEKQQIVYSNSVADDLLTYCRNEDLRRVVLVADSNTYAVTGDNIRDRLREAGLSLTLVILNGNCLAADEHAIASVLIDADVSAEAFIAVGSGTITDITRLVSHRSRKRFLSVPTAPSVDGYSSSGAPISLNGYKQSIRCHPPEIIFASLPTLTNAPADMIGAGFGDILGKMTALADWELAHIILGSRFDRAIAEEAAAALKVTMDNAAGISQRHPAAIRVLFDALILTGESINKFGGSAPASGSEHHISHYIEMKALHEGRKPILHGSKVAVGTVIASRWYKELRSWTKDFVASLPLEVPNYERDLEDIREDLGSAGDILLDSNDFLSTMSGKTLQIIRSRLLDSWDEVQRVAQTVLDPDDVTAALRSVGAPTSANELGLSNDELERAARLSHFVRSRFTIKTLRFCLGLPAHAEV